jgi:mannose-6-phosphate isomerase-like protein (cupin superfamily)
MGFGTRRFQFRPAEFCANGPPERPTPAVLYFIEGQAEVKLGEDKVSAQPGSFVYMPRMLSHGISAKTAVRMLLVQVKAP